MKLIKKGLIILVLVIIIFACYGIYYYNSNIVVKYKKYMNNFFGDVEWKVTDKNTYSTNLKVYRYGDRDSYNDYYYKEYTKWTIEITDSLGKTNTYTISNYHKVINNYYYGVFDDQSYLRYNDKEILAEQLFEIACELNETYIKKELLSTVLSQKELEYVIVKFRYDDDINSNSWLKFLDKDWFNYTDVNAENLTNNGILECYLNIYTMSNLNEELQIQMEEKIDDIIQLLQDTYKTEILYDISVGTEQRSNL